MLSLTNPWTQAAERNRIQTVEDKIQIQSAQETRTTPLEEVLVYSAEKTTTSTDEETHSQSTEETRTQVVKEPYSQSPKETRLRTLGVKETKDKTVEKPEETEPMFMDGMGV